MPAIDVMAHDELGCQLGDHVQIVESRPILGTNVGLWKRSLRHDIAAGATPLEELDLEARNDPAGNAPESCR